jgi:hypothetical protein
VAIVPERASLRELALYDWVMGVAIMVSLADGWWSC